MTGQASRYGHTRPGSQDPQRLQELEPVIPGPMAGLTGWTPTRTHLSHLGHLFSHLWLSHLICNAPFTPWTNLGYMYLSPHLN